MLSHSVPANAAGKFILAASPRELLIIERADVRLADGSHCAVPFLADRRRRHPVGGRASRRRYADRRPAVDVFASRAPQPTRPDTQWTHG